MKKNLLLTSVAVVVALLCAAVYGFEKIESREFKIAKNIDLFSSIVKELDMLYVDTLNPDKTIREGIDAMLYSLDPYTEFYPEDDQSELEQMLNNSYGGIGSVITWNEKEQRVMISEPYEGMPAATTGLKAGDVLLELDGKDLKGKNTQEVSEMLRGQAGTEFVLKVQRPGTQKPLSFNIVRRSVELPFIPYYGVWDNGVGYISLTTFSGNPSGDFRQAFLDLKKQGIKSLVIDLRNNGGGLLDEAVEIANMFLPKGKTLVSTKGRDKRIDRTYSTLREPIDLDIPIAVLVNSGTASASEILAGSLQDLDRAVVVGGRTYGKGLVQTTRTLPYGGVMKLTISKYYIPSGRCVQAIDYSHRNEDGSVGRIPDSLTTVFHTAAGREVRDGGGVTPDVEVERTRVPNIVLYLNRDNLLFDYATQYVLKHHAIAPSKEFALTDADYAEFKAMVLAADFKYDQQSALMLKDLREVVEFEGYAENTKAEFEALEKKLQHNLEHDLDYFAKDIRRQLAIEVQKRYYYQKGGLIESLKEDTDLIEAVKVLNDDGRYRQILSPVAKAGAGQ